MHDRIHLIKAAEARVAARRAAAHNWIPEMKTNLFADDSEAEDAADYLRRIRAARCRRIRIEEIY